MKNNTKIIFKFNEIQVIIIHLEIKYEIIEYIIKEILKTYANIIKTLIINIKKKIITKIYI